MKKQKEEHIGVDGGGTLRAAVFGINDGLVSNTSLIFGIAGATNDRHTIIIGGIAGLLAGAFSMAAGEWVSMQSQREMFEREIAIEQQELIDNPEFEREELAQIYHKRGIPLQEARKMARKLMKDPKHALDLHAREELGLNPDELGSPWKAAFSSFFSFIIGAAIPLLPFIFFAGTTGAVVAGVLAGIALFTVGAALGWFTRKHVVWAGTRMLLIGATAAVVTHAIGVWLGVNLS